MCSISRARGRMHAPLESLDRAPYPPLAAVRLGLGCAHPAYLSSDQNTVRNADCPSPLFPAARGAHLGSLARQAVGLGSVDRRYGTKPFFSQQNPSGGGGWRWLSVCAEFQWTPEASRMAPRTCWRGLCAGGLLELAVRAQQRWGGVWSTSVAAVVYWSGLGGATVGMCLLGSQMLLAAWEVIQLNKNEPPLLRLRRLLRATSRHTQSSSSRLTKETKTCKGSTS